MSLQCKIGEVPFMAEEGQSGSGRHQYRAQGKMHVGGKRYQVQILVTEIWAKDDPRRGGEAPVEASAPVRKPAKAAPVAAAAKAF